MKNPPENRSSENFRLEKWPLEKFPYMKFYSVKMLLNNPRMCLNMPETEGKITVQAK